MRYMHATSNRPMGTDVGVDDTRHGPRSFGGVKDLRVDTIYEMANDSGVTSCMVAAREEHLVQCDRSQSYIRQNASGAYRWYVDLTIPMTPGSFRGFAKPACRRCESTQQPRIGDAA